MKSILRYTAMFIVLVIFLGDCSFSLAKGKKGKILQKKENIHTDLKKSSHLVVVKDWSECSSPCGGGFQFRIRHCKRPLNGPPCIGKVKETRPCNPKPCSIADFYKLNTNSTSNETEFISPVVQFKYISKRRQKFVDCEIKEIDMKIVKEFIPFKKNHKNLTDTSLRPSDSKFPMRVVMDLHSLKIFEDDEKGVIYKSFPLNKIKIIKPYYKDKENCLRIGNYDETAVMCAFTVNHKDDKEIMTKWVKDILDFRDNCRKKEKTSSICSDISNKPSEDLINLNQVLFNSTRISLSNSEMLKKVKYDQRIHKEKQMKEEMEDYENKRNLKKIIFSQVQKEYNK